MMKNRKILSGGLFSLVAGWILVLSCYQGDGAYRSSNHEVVIGAVLPLSGPAAIMGENTRNGLLIAKRDANQGQWGDLPFKIEIDLEDGAGIPKTSISGFQKLVSKKTRIILTTLSSPAMVLRDLAKKNDVLLLANASHPEITDGISSILRFSNTANQESELIVGALQEKESARKIAVAVQNDDYGRAFITALKTAIQKTEIKLFSVRQYDPQGYNAFKAGIDARQLMAKNPEAIILVGMGEDLGLLIRRLREYGFAGKIFCSLGFSLVPGALEAAGDAAQGVMYTTFLLDDQDPQYQRLNAEYQAMYQRPITAEAVIAYNSVKIVAQAIQEVGLNPKALANHVRMQKTFQGVGLNAQVTELGDLLPELTLAEYRS